MNVVKDLKEDMNPGKHKQFHGITKTLADIKVKFNKETKTLVRQWWHMLLIPAHGSQKQWISVSLVYKASPRTAMNVTQKIPVLKNQKSGDLGDRGDRRQHKKGSLEQSYNQHKLG